MDRTRRTGRPSGKGGIAVRVDTMPLACELFSRRTRPRAEITAIKTGQATAGAATKPSLPREKRPHCPGGLGSNLPGSGCQQNCRQSDTGRSLVSATSPWGHDLPVGGREQTADHPLKAAEHAPSLERQGSARRRLSAGEPSRLVWSAVEGRTSVPRPVDRICIEVMSIWGRWPATQPALAIPLHAVNPDVTC